MTELEELRAEIMGQQSLGRPHFSCSFEVAAQLAALVEQAQNAHQLAVDSNRELIDALWGLGHVDMAMPDHDESCAARRRVWEAVQKVRCR